MSERMMREHGKPHLRINKEGRWVTNSTRPTCRVTQGDWMDWSDARAWCRRRNYKEDRD